MKKPLWRIGASLTEHIAVICLSTAQGRIWNVFLSLCIANINCAKIQRTVFSLLSFHSWKHFLLHWLVLNLSTDQNVSDLELYWGVRTKKEPLCSSILLLLAAHQMAAGIPSQDMKTLAFHCCSCTASGNHTAPELGSSIYLLHFIATGRHSPQISDNPLLFVCHLNQTALPVLWDWKLINSVLCEEVPFVCSPESTVIVFN